MANVIERAMTLAGSGQHTTLRAIRAALRKEGFTHYELASLGGREIQRQLRALMVQAAAPADP
ncbi:MAG: hypothetical protein J0I19_12185 [Alphaproteobacteria bacterium]|nr:hypothetical protein [Alphaproteobacteria bacterium]